MSYRFDHLHIVCRDLEGMIDFFTQNFDTALIERRPFSGSPGAALDLGGTTINLRLARENEPLLHDKNIKPLGFHHIGIAVDNVDTEYQRLTGQGYHFTTLPTDITGYRIAFFNGPENLTIEIMSPSNQ
jgi:catechol 2,3-dioxygenase-like lactoylglutathione lyase family enzyme